MLRLRRNPSTNNLRPQGALIKVKRSQSHPQHLIIKFRLRFLRRELHADIVLCEPVHRPSAICLLKQHFGSLSDMSCIEGLRFLVRQRQQSPAPQFLILLTDHVWNTQRRRARTLGIREHMQLRYWQSLQQLVGLFKAFGCLTPTAYHHIDTQEGIGHSGFDGEYLISKQLAVIMPMHQFQHCVTSALQRNMEMRHERTALCTIGYQLLTDQVGLQTADTIALNALNHIEPFHQVQKLLTSSLSEIADIHASQHNLLAALSCSLFSLFDQRLNRRVPAKPARVRYSTIGTEIVASILNFQEIPGSITPRTAWRKAPYILRLLRIICRLPFRMLRLRRNPSSPCFRQELNQRGLFIRSQHQVYALHLSDTLRLQLRIAPRHHNEGPRMLSHQSVYHLSALMVSHIGHRAGIHQHQVSLLALASGCHAQLLQHLAEGRRLREIQLAAQRGIGCLLTLKSRIINHNGKGTNKAAKMQII